MNTDDFIAIFKDSFDELDTEITGATKFKELDEWTSMQALLLIAHIDDTINVVLEAEDLRNASTVEDLFKIVSRR